jgi:signal transduction histidine kinase
MRARLAIAVAGVALLGGMLSLFVWPVNLGLTLVANGDQVTITKVDEHGPAALEGFDPGMVVERINGLQLMTLPEYVYASPGPDGDAPADPIGIKPELPTPIHQDAGVLAAAISSPIQDLEAIRSADLQNFSPGSNAFTFLSGDYDGQLRRSIVGYLAGAAIVVVGSWWLLQGRGGRSLQPMAFPLAVAVATPLLVQPLVATWAAPAVALAGAAVPLAMLPLGLSLLDHVADGPSHVPIRLAVLGCAAAAVIIGVSRVWLPATTASADVLWAALSAAVAIVPGVAAAAPGVTAESRTASSGRLLQASEYAVAGVTPSMALLTGSTQWNFLFPLSVWLLALVVAGRFTIRPLARVAVRAQLQRDVVVAATEAERARVAADIHDDALQELTLLVQRLDKAGDAEGAEIARAISDRLRAICGDLRLPILDDLGVGPALDWLVARIERLSGGEVRLERSDGTRLPADVELGIFRVAQEALSNAVKHGRPPIIVRYRASAAGASLSVDDAGTGIAPDAAAHAESEGRFGLLNMQQRAEQIGAILDVRRWPGGGTHVALEWRSH